MSLLNVNIPDSLQRRAEWLAKGEGILLEQFVAAAVTEKVAAMDADSYIHKRSLRGSREKFDQVMAKVPDVEPISGD